MGFSRQEYLSSINKWMEEKRVSINEWIYVVIISQQNNQSNLMWENRFLTNGAETTGYIQEKRKNRFEPYLTIHSHTHTYKT